MKRLMAIALALVIMVGLVGCNGKPKNMSDGTYNIGVQALEEVDKYLDAKAESKDTANALEKLYYRMDEFKPTDDNESTAHVLVSGDILLINTTLSRIAYDSKIEATDRSETAEDVKEKRNKLAERLGKKKK